MQETQIDIAVEVKCACGKELHQIKWENDGGLIITVTACHYCQEEARRQAYDNGMRDAYRGE